jgi:hypothetical protein
LKLYIAVTCFVLYRFYGLKINLAWLVRQAMEALLCGEICELTIAMRKYLVYTRKACDDS